MSSATLKQTLALIKPGVDAAAEAVIRKTISNLNLQIAEERAVRLCRAEAEELLQDRRSQHWFQEAVDYLCSGTVTALKLVGVDAITYWRDACGDEDPHAATEMNSSRAMSSDEPYHDEGDVPIDGASSTRAAPGLRARFGCDIVHNAVHASNSKFDAARETFVLFPGPARVERTLAIIKPGAFEHAAAIEAEIAAAGLRVVAERVQAFGEATIAQHYKEHRGKPYFSALVEHMCSDFAKVLVLEGDRAILRWRLLMGPGFLARNVHAKVGEPKFISIARTHHPHPSTLRGRFGTDATRTGLHGSDSAEAAERELAFWFPELVSGQGKIPLRILCCAEPFGFGPPAAVSIVAKHLRPHVEHLSYAGVGHTLDLQRGVGYDEVLDVDPSSPEFEALLSRFDVVISNTEWDAMQFAVSQGLIVIGMDQLLWYWDDSEFCHLPECAQHVDAYLATAFFGVRERLESVYRHLRPVAQVVSRPGHRHDSCAQPGVATEGAVGPIHVSFGGLFNPTIEDEAFHAYVVAVSLAVKSQPHYLLGNAKIKDLTKLPIEYISQGECERRLKQSRAAVLTSGLGHILETLSAGIPVVWLPPTNPSQARQLQLLRDRGIAPFCVTWAQLLGEEDEMITLRGRPTGKAGSLVCAAGEYNCFAYSISEVTNHLNDCIRGLGQSKRLQEKMTRLVQEYLQRIDASHGSTVALATAESSPARVLEQLFHNTVSVEEAALQFLREKASEAFTITVGPHLPTGDLRKVSSDQTKVLARHQSASLRVLMVVQPGFKLGDGMCSSLAAHVPGFSSPAPGWGSGEPIFRVFQHYVRPGQEPHVRVDSATEHGISTTTIRLFTCREEGQKPKHEQQIPADFLHAFYGACRACFLRARCTQALAFPVHAACVQLADKSGYALIMGLSGAGKSSTALLAAESGSKVFSGDKTLVQFDNEGRMWGCAGTRTFTVRSRDEHRWMSLQKVNCHRLGSRLAFQLREESYFLPSVFREAATDGATHDGAAHNQVLIRSIVFVRLGEQAPPIVETLSSLSALHQLYPAFLDTVRGDVLVGGDSCLLDGAVPLQVRRHLQLQLACALENVAVLEYIGSPVRLDLVGLPKPTPPSVNVSGIKVLFGVCGVGNGHRNRQIPIIEFLLKRGARLVVFTYGDSCLAFFRLLEQRFPSSLTVLEVFNPWFVGCPSGLDFAEAAKREHNKSATAARSVVLNCHAMSEAARLLGTPDLVVADYENVSAQFAYSCGAPLVTIDQQSKYFLSGFPSTIAGTSAQDEVERLRMFFPIAAKRIALTFFAAPMNQNAAEASRASPKSIDVCLMGPVMKDHVIELQKARNDRDQCKSGPKKIVMYLTSQKVKGGPRILDWVAAASKVPPGDAEFDIFAPANDVEAAAVAMESVGLAQHVHLHSVPSPYFSQCLLIADGVVSTAGHTLLSECMFAAIPVLAVPLPSLYEQQMNALAVSSNHFGLQPSGAVLSSADIMNFCKKAWQFEQHIRTARDTSNIEPLLHASTVETLWAQLESVIAARRTDAELSKNHGTVATVCGDDDRSDMCASNDLSLQAEGRVGNLAIARAASISLVTRVAELILSRDSSLAREATLRLISVSCTGDRRCIIDSPIGGYLHHDHHLTVRDLESLGVFNIFAVADTPWHRIESGHRRRLDRHAMDRRANQIYLEHFEDVNDFIDAYRHQTTEAVQATNGGQRWILPVAKTYLNGQDPRTRITWIRLRQMDKDWARVGVPGSQASVQHNASSKKAGVDPRAKLNEQSLEWVRSEFARDIEIYEAADNVAERGASSTPPTTGGSRFGLYVTDGRGNAVQ